MIDLKSDSAKSITRRTALKAGTTALVAAQGTLKASAAGGDIVDDPITSMDALSLSKAIATKTVSCVEVMDAYLNRIDRLNPVYNAIVSLAPRHKLMAQAEAADQELAAGRYRGWMHGMPHAIKDLADLKGFVNTVGSPIFKDNVSTEDSLFVGRIRAAGAIFIGKTNAPEWGLGSQTYNQVFGSTGSAWNPKLTAGGSSGGAASGIATHMLPIADGSDMMGSLRNPAAFNNIVGFRPSQGRIPSLEADLFFQQLACDGPMGRTVSDVARLLDTMAGYDPRSPLSRKDPVFSGELQAPVLKSMRLGWMGDYNGYLPMETGVLEVCGVALQDIAAEGLNVEFCTPEFDLARLWKTWLTFRHWTISSGAKALYDDPEKRAQMKPELRWEIEGGIPLSGDDLATAARARSEWYLALNSLFETYDFVALPTAQVFPFSRDLHWPKEIAGKTMDTYHRWMEVVIGGTLSGCPVINLPAGFDGQGRPMGIQVIAPMGEDQKLLEFGLAYEAHTDYLQRKPPLVSSL